MTKRLVTYILLCLCLLCEAAVAQNGKRFTLVIDPGHGGKDTGAPGAYSVEKNINLKVALAFGQLVERNCPDVKVIYTRKTDIFIPLQTRADIANNAKADLFVSIHTNAVDGNRSAYGSETYTLGMARAEANLEVAKRENSVITYEKDYRQRYEGFDPRKSESYVIFELMQDRYMKQSVDLAQAIQRQYVRNNRRDKGVHQAGFLVLRKTSMPAVLTELGFITTPDEEAYLNSDRGVITLATCIYNGFLQYRKMYDRTAVGLPQPIFTSSDEPVVAAEDTNTPPAEVVPMPSTTPQPTRPAERVVIVDPAPSKAANKPIARTQTKTPTTLPSKTTQPTKPTQPTKASSTLSKDKTAKTERTTSSDNAKQKSIKGLHYRIQIAVNSDRLSSEDKQFRGLDHLYIFKEGGRFKYVTGIYATKAEAQAALKEVRKSFSDAFIVKFNGNTHVP